MANAVQPTRHRINRFLKVLLLLGALAACGSAAFLYKEFRASSDNPTESKGDISLIRRHLKEVIGIDLPETSSLTHYRSDLHFTKSDWIARVSVPIDTFNSLEEQIQSLDRGAPIASPSLPESTEWWTPQRIVTRASLEKFSPPVRIQLILTNEPTGPALYIEWSQR
jgi:hypothetical protein